MAKRRRHSWYYVQDARKAGFRSYVTAAGQASLQWNVLHESMGLLFVTLMGGGFMNQFAAVWSSAPSDRAKRAMLIAALDSRQEMIGPDISAHDKQKAALIKYLCGQTNELENKRNDIVHAPLANVHHAHPVSGTALPDTLLGNVRAKSLEGKDLLKEFRHCRDYARILGQLARDLDFAISHVRTLPDKPRPPSRDDRKKDKHPQRPDAKLTHRPRSSRG